LEYEKEMNVAVVVVLVVVVVEDGVSEGVIYDGTVSKWPDPLLPLSKSLYLRRY